MKFNMLYKNIFLYASLQFCGNIEEYFAKHTEKLVVFLVMPRVQSKDTIIRFYSKGKLVEEKNILLFSNIFLYYISWYVNYILLILKYFKRNERFYLISFHPLPFFFMTLQKTIRQIDFVYWIGDYFPGINKILVMFEKLKKFYHNKVNYSCYLSDTINKIMNGEVLNSDNRKTVMWGVRPKAIKRSFNGNNFNILFVGLIKESQGLEFFYDFLKVNKKYKLKVIGVCDKKLYLKHMSIIKRYGIKDQIYFPNKFFSDEELNEISKECQVGIALYDIDKSNATYYTDPGKVKAYTELGLPVIMSNISSVAPYILKFKAGEVVNRNSESIKSAITKVRKNYKDYLDGVNKFNKYFYFEDYYKERFKFLEQV